MLKNDRPRIVADGYEPLNDLIDGFVANGGKIWICPACARAKGIGEDDLTRSGVDVDTERRDRMFTDEPDRIRVQVRIVLAVERFDRYTNRIRHIVG